MSASTPQRRRWRGEWPLIPVAFTTGMFLAFGKAWLADLSHPVWFGILLVWLVGALSLAAFSTVRHAESLAARLGEPFGTLILTLSVTVIEVMMIAAVMSSGTGSSTLGRDAMFAVIMIILNGMVGLSLLLGGLRYHEQTYNLQGASTFLAVIVPLAVLGLILPNVTVSTPGATFSPIQAVLYLTLSLGLYGVFLAIQNVRHKEYFVDSHPATGQSFASKLGSRTRQGIYFDAALLLANLIPAVILAKQMGVPINHGIRVMHAPATLGGFLVAMLILAPESLGAIRAARSNQLQRSVNILLGSVLATISLTIPAIWTIGYFTGQTVVLGLDPVNTVLLLLTLGVCLITFASARTNVLQGAVHILLFLAYLILMFER